MVQEIEIKLRTRVVVTNSEGRWFARGLDIDYAAQGRSYYEVQKAFEVGFVATVQDHFETYGDLRYFDKPAPEHIFDRYKSAIHASGSGVLLPLNEQEERVARIEYLAA